MIKKLAILSSALGLLMTAGAYADDAGYSGMGQKGGPASQVGEQQKPMQGSEGVNTFGGGLMNSPSLSGQSVGSSDEGSSASSPGDMPCIGCEMNPSSSMPASSASASTVGGSQPSGGQPGQAGQQAASAIKNRIQNGSSTSGN